MLWTALVLSLAALATSIVSGVLGMAGGILLLAVMLSFLPHAEAIPTHAAVQLCSNSTRLVAFARDIVWSTVGRFVLGVVPGAVVGSTIYYLYGTHEASEPWLKMLVGAYILVVTFLPKPRKQTNGPSSWAWPAIGFVAGGAALTVGAVGPLIAPVFARCGFVKERLVATKAVCQAILHLVKLPVFIVAGAAGRFETFDFGRLGLLTLLMILMVIPGTLIGKRLLRHVSETQFTRLYTLALVLAGGKVLLYDGAYVLLAPG